MSNRVKHAIIPVAGLGTRFLPVTKVVPKELLPIVDKPILLYIVEEAVKSGIETVVLVSGRGKNAIEDFFDTSYELETQLAKKGQHQALEEINKIKNLCEVVSVRQKEALGLGHAVLCGANVVHHNAFAVLLGDEIMLPAKDGNQATAKLCQQFINTGKSTVAIMPVEPREVSKYGIVEHRAPKNGIYDITRVVEKPSPTEAPSQLALPGRYVFHAELFEHLKTTKPGKNGEIQLTDAMNALAQSQGLQGCVLPNERFDAGDRLGYLKANIEFGLRDPRIGADLAAFLKQRGLSI